MEIMILKQNVLISLIKDKTGLVAEPNGLGADTEDYISGSAQSNGYEKGDPYTDRSCGERPLYKWEGIFELEYTLQKIMQILS